MDHRADHFQVLLLLAACTGAATHPVPRRSRPCRAPVPPRHAPRDAPLAPSAAGPRVTLRAMGVVVAVGLLACGQDPPPPPPAGMVTDSTGVQVVSSPTPRWTAGSGWTVDSVPVLSIGTEEGEEHDRLTRVKGAFLLDDGGIIIADGGSSELRLFDSTGSFVRSAGRKGPGPGEFGGLGDAARCGTAIWVNASNRVSIWDLSLRFQREFITTDMIMWPLVCFNGRAVLVKDDLAQNDNAPIGEFETDSLRLMVLDSLGAMRRTVVDIAVWQRLAVRTPRNGIVSFPHPFAPTTIVASQDSLLVVGRGVRFALEYHAMDGRLVRRVIGPEPPPPDPRRLLAGYASAPLEGMDARIREYLAIGNNQMPDPIAAYSDVTVDREGNTWVKRFHLPATPWVEWGIFDPEGWFLGDVALPGNLTVHEIGADYLLASRADSLGVERVHRYRILK